MSVSESESAALVASCTPCEDPAGHQYDDDRQSLMWGWPGPWSALGDPCMWCDHEKCAACPPPRGGTFTEEHDAGREVCWAPYCPQPACRKAVAEHV